jgi:NAD-dependent deacetylase
MIQPLDWTADTFVLVLTGAGVSAESGVPTFRGVDGLWERHRIEDVASPAAFERDPALVWRFYSQRREGAASCTPNPGHAALAELERTLESRFLLATQNVDGLHHKAGSKRVVELHGNLFRTRCSGCSRPAFVDHASYPADALPRCGCGALLRPDIVWFGEYLDPVVLAQIGDFLDGAAGRRLVFLAVGTSGAVYPAAGFVHEARARGGQTYLVNADVADNAGAFHHFLQGKSGEVLPQLFRR